MIRTVATLGRGNTKEFVTEYVILYSDDGEQWRPYVNPDGEVQVTNTTHTRTVQHPRAGIVIIQCVLRVLVQWFCFPLVSLWLGRLQLLQLDDGVGMYIFIISCFVD